MSSLASLSRRVWRYYLFYAAGFFSLVAMLAIAEQLGLSPKTVHVHRANLMDKLKVSNNVELALKVPAGKRLRHRQEPVGKQAREQRRASAQARQQLAQKTRPYKQELTQVEERLAALSAEKNQLEERLTQGLAPAEIAECGKRLKACGDEVDALEERWLELSETIQEIENSA